MELEERNLRRFQCLTSGVALRGDLAPAAPVVQRVSVNARERRSGLQRLARAQVSAERDPHFTGRKIRVPESSPCPPCRVPVGHVA